LALYGPFFDGPEAGPIVFNFKKKSGHFQAPVSRSQRLTGAGAAQLKPSQNDWEFLKARRGHQKKGPALKNPGL
jgi:hypothetical protein